MLAMNTLDKRYLCIFLSNWKESLKETTKQELPNINADIAFAYLCKLIPWTHKYAPLVALDRELINAYRTQSLDKVSDLHNGLILDTTGTERLHGSELQLLQKISSTLSKRNISHRLVLSPSVGASWACSRFGDKPIAIITKDSLQESLYRLPPSALRLSEDNLELLRKLGINRIGQLLEFPSKALKTRFGPLIVTRIEQALAQIIEPLICAHVKEAFITERLFDIPVSATLSLQIIVKELFCELLDQLNKKEKVAGSFFVKLYPDVRNEVSAPFVKQFSLFEASNNKNHLISVIEPWLSTIRANNGIKKIVVEAKFTKNTQNKQEDFYSKEKIFSPLPELINQLVIRLGKNHVAKIIFKESHIPEKSFGYQSVMESTQKYPIVPKTTERPSHIFNIPQQINAVALLPDNPPASISWKGEKLIVSLGIGPERISPEWWFNDPNFPSETGTRDYFKLQDQHGRWLWVYRSLPEMKWFIHGIWN